MKFFKSTLYLFACLLFLPVFIQAEIPPAPNPPKLVNDFAGMLSGDFANTLERELVTYEQNTSTQIAVVTVETLDGFDIAQYGTELAHSWGIGSKKDNGVLILLAKQERRVNISTGYGVEHLLTDALSKQIIEDYMTPEFKKGSFDQGIAAGVQSIAQALKGEFVNEKGSSQSKGAFGLGGSAVLLIVLFFLFLLRGRSIIGRRRARHGIVPGLLLGGHRSSGFGGSGFGGGGGFGGFGGGGFGGGGASGGW